MYLFESPEPIAGQSDDPLSLCPSAVAPVDHVCLRKANHLPGELLSTQGPDLPAFTSKLSVPDHC